MFLYIFITKYAAGYKFTIYQLLLLRTKIKLYIIIFKMIIARKCIYLMKIRITLFMTICYFFYYYCFQCVSKLKTDTINNVYLYI